MRADPEQTRSPKAEMKRRLRLVCSVAFIGLPAVGIAATQFVAWRLDYHPTLGPALFAHVYAPWRFIEWMNAPWAESTPKTFAYLHLGLYAAAGIVLFAAIRGMQGRQRPMKHEGVHGTARFATREELPNTGLMPPNHDVPWPGVYAGAWEEKDGSLDYLRHYGPEHVLCLGPLRSGKAVACVVPTLLSWPHSALVYDEKGELWEYASGWRSQEGGNVVIRWEPAAIRDTAAWNPLNEIRLGTDFEFRDAAVIAEILADPSGKGQDRHFDPVGSALLTGVILYVCYESAGRREPGTLAAASHAMARGDALYQAMIDNKFMPGGKPHEGIARLGHQQKNREARERTGVASTVSRFLKMFEDPIVAANTSRSDLRIDDLTNHDKPVSVFVVTRAADKESMTPLIRLFFTMAMNELCSADLKIVEGKQVSPHKHRMLMLLDEFASLGRMQRFQDQMAKCAGYGIKCFLLTQDREQIIDAYGQHESITSNCHVKVLFAPTNEATARWISALLGTGTVVVEDVSESGTKGVGSKNYSRTYRTVSRPLMTADEVMRLKTATKSDNGKDIVLPGEVLIHTAGSHTIRGLQSLFFRDPNFQRRAVIARVATNRLARKKNEKTALDELRDFVLARNGSTLQPASNSAVEHHPVDATGPLRIPAE